MSFLSSLYDIVVTVSVVVSAFTPLMLAIINREQKRASRMAAEKAEVVRTTLQDQTDMMGHRLNEISNLLAEKITLHE